MFLGNINPKSHIKKKSLEWTLYEPYEEDGKDNDLKWYFFTFYYAKKPDKMK